MSESQLTKVCSKCKEEKLLEEFCKNKSAKNGYSVYCLICVREINKDYYYKNLDKQRNRKIKFRNLNLEKIKFKSNKYKKENKLKIVESSKKYRDANVNKLQEYREKNKEKAQTRSKLYYANNKSKCISAVKKWTENNINKHRQYQNTWKANRLKIDFVFKFSIRLRQDFSKRLKELIGNKKQHKTAYYLEDSFQGYVDYITALFRPGMTWENWGEVWHLDHKLPLVSFDFGTQDAQNEQQIKACWSKQNLQPLTVQENLEKNDKILPEFEYLIPILNPINVDKCPRG